MSAFVVSHSLIDAVVTAAVSDRVHGGPYYRKHKGGNHVQMSQAGATELGRILLAENERSVLDRYPDVTVDTAPGTIGETSANYRYKERQASPVAVLKALDCLSYQSCETDDWEDSEAFRIIDVIRSRAISRLPGYENGPGWDDFDHRKDTAA